MVYLKIKAEIGLRCVGGVQIGDYLDLTQDEGFSPVRLVGSQLFRQNRARQAQDVSLEIWNDNGVSRSADAIPQPGAKLNPVLPRELVLAATAGAAPRQQAGAGAAQPPVFLNHFFVVVDAASYQAARSSAFLTRELAPFEARTTVRNDMSYTGIYWYGRRTYFELFEPGSQGQQGASGLALGVEEPGASAGVRRRWQEALGAAGGGPVTRKTENDEPPWFEMTFSREIPGLRVFLMEYHAEFLVRWYGELTKPRSIARADVLDRYVAKIGLADRRERALLQDVVGLEIALAPPDRETLVKQLRAVSWLAQDAGEAVVCSGPESVPAAPGGAEERTDGDRGGGLLAPACGREGRAPARQGGAASRWRLRAARGRRALAGRAPGCDRLGRRAGSLRRADQQRDPARARALRAARRAPSARQPRSARARPAPGPRGS